METGDERGARVAHQFINDLRAQGVEVLTDTETLTDFAFTAFLKQELPLCQYLILVQTPATLKSPRVQTAVNMALALLGPQDKRGVLSLVVVRSAGKDARVQWSADRTFDASVDYQRARDRLFLTLGLIQLNEPNLSASLYAGVPAAPPGSVGLAPASPSGFPLTTPVSGPQTGSSALPPVPSGNAYPFPPAGPQSGLVVTARPAPVARPRNMLQTLATRFKGPAISDMDTLREDQPLPLKQPLQLWIRMALIAMVVLALLLGATFTIIQVRKHAGQTTRTQHTGTATPHTTTTPALSATGETGDINPLSTVDRYITANTTLVLDDSMAQNASDSSWQVNASGPNSCSFQQQSYYEIISTGPNYCLANKGSFGNFDYQIEMRIIQGNTAGVIFRATDQNQTYYYFQINTNGQFFLWRIDGPQSAPVLVPKGSGNAAAINQGAGQPNLLGISALNGHIVCYVNGIALVSIDDATYLSGYLGVMVGQNNNSSVTAATYQYARVWTA
jgi:hypothetical protein